MSNDNPYQAPLVVSPAALAPVGSPEIEFPALIPEEPVPAVSTVDTIVPRLIASNVDVVIALILGVFVAKWIPNKHPFLQLVGFVVFFLGYYLVSEGLFARTLGKLMTGLIVIPFDGGKCTWRQALIRTGWRVLEVNPVLLGALPAGLSVLFSRHHQRIGDKVAKTIVVPARRMRKQRQG